MISGVDIEDMKPENPDSLQWEDCWGCQNTMTHKGATDFLREFFNEWPGGLEEIEAVIAMWKRHVNELL